MYGYLKPNVKKTVDQIVAELAKKPVMKKMYEKWCSLEQRIYEIYTSTVQKFQPLEENKVLKSIKNEVIRVVFEMEFSTEMFVEYDEDVFDKTESDGDLYIKWTAEYKSAFEELNKNRNVPKALDLFQAEAEKGISSRFRISERCTETACSAKIIFSNPKSILKNPCMVLLTSNRQQGA